MARTKVENGMMYIYSDETNQWFPKYKEIKGLRYELDEKYFVYVLAGDTMDESIQRNEELDKEIEQEIEEADLSPYYGFGRKKNLEENYPLDYGEMMFNNTLLEHLKEIESQAQEMEDKLVEEYKASEGVTEELKASNQMEWAARINNITHRVREVIQKEIIFV